MRMAPLPIPHRVQCSLHELHQLFLKQTLWLKFWRSKGVLSPFPWWCLALLNQMPPKGPARSRSNRGGGRASASAKAKSAPTTTAPSTTTSPDSVPSPESTGEDAPAGMPPAGPPPPVPVNFKAPAASIRARGGGADREDQNEVEVHSAKARASGPPPPDPASSLHAMPTTAPVALGPSLPTVPGDASSGMAALPGTTTPMASTMPWTAPSVPSKPMGNSGCSYSDAALSTACPGWNTSQAGSTESPTSCCDHDRDYGLYCDAELDDHHHFPASSVASFVPAATTRYGTARPPARSPSSEAGKNLNRRARVICWTLATSLIVSIACLPLPVLRLSPWFSQLRS